MANIETEYKAKEVTGNPTEQQVETFLNNANFKGYEFVGVFVLGAKQFAIFRRAIKELL